MSKRQIRAAFESKLNTWAAGKSPAIPVAWENVNFTPPFYPYVRAFMLPADTDSLDLEGKHRSYIGIFQVNIIGETGKGPAQVERLAEELAALFPLNLRMPVADGEVLVSSPMNEGPAASEDGAFTLPVWWRYRMDTI